MVDTKERVPSWREVQDLLKQCKKSTDVLGLLKAEARGQARPLFLTRMQGRFRVLRTEEDNAMIDSIIKVKGD